MAERGLFKPSSRGIRSPTSNEKQNGQIANPPRMAEMGGFSSTRKGFARNNMSIKKPGDTR